MNEKSILISVLLAIPYGYLLTIDPIPLHASYLYLVGILAIVFVQTVLMFYLSSFLSIFGIGSIVCFIIKYCPPVFFFAGLWSMIFSNYVSFGFIGHGAAHYLLIGLGGWLGYSFAKNDQIKWLKNKI
jgi:hypothetical protein